MHKMDGLLSFAEAILLSIFFRNNFFPIMKLSINLAFFRFVISWQVRATGLKILV